MGNPVPPTRLLITVMTYPHPSERHQELVCAAGITENREWVRLYPVDFRYRPRKQQFRKYQWIEVTLGPEAQGNDRRKESRKPDLATLRVLGEPLSTKSAWRERRTIIDAMPHNTVTELETAYESEGVSLGIVRPLRILDMKMMSRPASLARADRNTKPLYNQYLGQE